MILHSVGSVVLFHPTSSLQYLPRETLPKTALFLSFSRPPDFSLFFDVLHVICSNLSNVFNGRYYYTTPSQPLKIPRKSPLILRAACPSGSPLQKFYCTFYIIQTPTFKGF
jgi:hypothetical protein